MDIKTERERRTLSDHGRMLWKDDVKDICTSPEVCFEYGQTVRCGPCAIKQAEAFGVESLNTGSSYLPEVCRLNHENKRLRQALQEIAEMTHRKQLPITSAVNEIANEALKK